MNTMFKRTIVIATLCAGLVYIQGCSSSGKVTTPEGDEQTPPTATGMMPSEFEAMNSPEDMLNTIVSQLRNNGPKYENITYGLSAAVIPRAAFLEAKPNEPSTLLEAINSNLDLTAENSQEPHYIDILQLGNGRQDDAFQLSMIDHICNVANSAQTEVIIRYLEGNSNISGTPEGNYFHFFQELTERFKGSTSKVTFYAANLDYTWSNLFNNPGSWNHAKIFAVDGNYSIVGGQNYWDDYVQSHNTNLYDLSYQVNGKISNQAHEFANFLWGYVANPSATGSTAHKSWQMGTSHTAGTDLPPAYDASKYPQPTVRGNVPVLAVGNLGLWYNESKYLLLQAASADTVIPGNTYRSLQQASNILVQYPFNTWAFEEAKALQASTTARNIALRMVKQNGHIRIAQQKIANTDVSQNHKILGKDYVIWPAEFLDAIVYAISEKNAQVDILVSHHNYAYSGGYSDDMGAAALRGVIIGQLAKKVGGKATAKNMANRFLHVKQMPENAYNHSKVWAVDDQLFYIGSDNIYPGYLQEYGYITGSSTWCNAFINGFWTNMWNMAVD